MLILSGKVELDFTAGTCVGIHVPACFCAKKEPPVRVDRRFVMRGINFAMYDREIAPLPR